MTTDKIPFVLEPCGAPTHAPLVRDRWHPTKGVPVVYLPLTELKLWARGAVGTTREAIKVMREAKADIERTRDSYNPRASWGMYSLHTPDSLALCVPIPMRHFDFVRRELSYRGGMKIFWAYFSARHFAHGHTPITSPQLLAKSIYDQPLKIFELHNAAAALEAVEIFRRVLLPRPWSRAPRWYLLSGE